MKRVTKETRDLQKIQQLLHAKTGPMHGLKQEITASAAASAASSATSPVVVVMRAPVAERNMSLPSLSRDGIDSGVATIDDNTAITTTTTATPTTHLINSYSNSNTNEAAFDSNDSTTMDVEAVDDHSNSTQVAIDAKSLKSEVASSSIQQLNITQQHLLSNKANSIKNNNTSSSSSSSTINMSNTITASSKSATQLELEHCHNVLSKSEAEREALFRSISLETQLHREVVRWMQAMQELLWPTTDEQVHLGRPLAPPPRVMIDDTSSSSSSYTEGDVLSIASYTEGIMKQLQLLTPLGLVHMEKAASIVGIFAVEDVKYILDIFKWLSWINLTLHLLRLPPTTPALRKILDAVQGLRCADDKVVKLLSAILQRAM